ncbi:DUF2953 domain-containing protein [Cohnella pontilimi]|nr:DUF2953 domain-containing protein [Cohnella pontilimi]
MAFWRFGTGLAFWLIVLAAAIVALIVAAWVSRIRIRVRYSRSGNNDQLVVIVRALYGAAGFQAEIPAIMLQSWNLIYRQELEATIGNRLVTRKVRWKVGGGAGRLLKLYRDNRQVRIWLLDTLKKVDCTRFRLDFRVGTGDAASTAVVSGLLWTVYGAAIAIAGRFMRLKAHPHGAVAPVYDGQEFSVVCETDMELRLGTALLSLMKLGTKAIRMGRTINYWRRSLAGP